MVVDDLSITITDDLPATYTADTPIIFYAYPVETNGAYPLPGDAYRIVVTTKWRIFIGDVLGIEATEGLLNSMGQYGVTEATQTAFDGTYYTYELVVNEPIVRPMVDGDRLFLVCNIGYESEDLRIPTSVGSYYSVVGPFLVDWFSGELLDNVFCEEIYALETYNAAGNVIDSIRQVEKNTPVIDAPMQASFPLFWRCVRGSLKYSSGFTHVISEAFETMEYTKADDLIVDADGSVTGTANTRYLELRYDSLGIEAVERNTVPIDYTYLGGALVALDQVELHSMRSRDSDVSISIARSARPRIPS